MFKPKRVVQVKEVETVSTEGKFVHVEKEKLKSLSRSPLGFFYHGDPSDHPMMFKPDWEIDGNVV